LIVTDDVLAVLLWVAWFY